MNLVRVYDFDSKRVSEIPEAELAPGMIQAQLDGVGLVWIRAARVKTGPIRHPPFSEELRGLLREIRTTFDEVYPKSLEDWEDGFRRDANAEQEIAAWYYAARKYQQCLRGQNYSLPQRQEVFAIIAACMTSPREQVLKIVQLSALPQEKATEAIEIFFAVEPDL